VNRLVLAVAGGRKTQSIVDHAVDAPARRRILVLTYTQRNQHELHERLKLHRPLSADVEVRGWFSFLLGHFVRPYLPRLFDGVRLRGLDFHGDPGMYAKGLGRFLDADGRAYKLHLAKLAVDVNTASDGAVLDRLSRSYDEIHVDEVQDLNGYDLDVLLVLMQSPINLHLVGDVRQAMLQTNVRDPRNKQYKGVAIKTWFDAREAAGELEVAHSFETWRCNEALAAFADRIFPPSWGFAPTVSRNEALTGHDGVFVVSKAHVPAYLREFDPLCLRHSANSAKDLDLPFRTIGESKGVGAERVLIGPTQGMLDFVRRGKALGDSGCCSLYVAVTRAAASVAFAVDDPSSFPLPAWLPDG
jgi:DNA helicase II / ATP-dependent DNA helicase PcrA